jgi:outer membrane immunogenic protein
MKTFLLGGVALITLGLVGSALAADMPIKAPVVVVDTWSGFYLGVDFGGIHGLNNTANFSQSGPPLFSAFDPVAFNVSPNWAETGGIHGGYNWQFDPSWVVGVEADFNKTNLSTVPGQLFLTSGGLPLPICDPSTPGSCHGLLMGNTLNWTATARARLGYDMKVGQAGKSALFYVTGGGAYASLESSGQVAAANFSTFSITTATNHMSAGWVAGGGFEVMATAHWLIRVEYLHYALNSGTTTTIACSACTPGAFSGPGTFTWSNSSFDVIRGGLSYKF